MDTQVVSIDSLHPQRELIDRAAAVLRRGGLVAFPTETVYGLGANALDAAAVAGIFLAKGRPSHNPVIVHIASLDEVALIAADWPSLAAALADHFWPGPLTLVLPKHAKVPDTVTAGGPTVGVRWPAHPVAQALIRAAGVPVAAPSANRSSELSPTRAEHVLRGLQDRIDMLLDGGPTPGGIESTVLDVTCSPPRLLRPGLVGHAELEALIGPIALPTPNDQPSAALPSPGMLARHYAPRTPLECSNNATELAGELTAAGLKVGLVLMSEPAAWLKGVRTLQLPGEPAGYAAELYAALHVLDDAGLDRIVMQLPPAISEWLAVHDRLRRAAASSITV